MEFGFVDLLSSPAATTVNPMPDIGSVVGLVLVEKVLMHRVGLSALEDRIGDCRISDSIRKLGCERGCGSDDGFGGLS